MVYVQLGLLVCAAFVFLAAVFGALFTVPRGARESFSYRLLMRATEPLRVGGPRLFFYCAFPVAMMLFFSLPIGALLLGINVIGAFVHPRLMAPMSSGNDGGIAA